MRPPHLLGAAGRGWLVLLLAATPLALLGLGAPLALPAAVTAAATVLLLLLLLARRRRKDGFVALQLADLVQQGLNGEAGGAQGCSQG